MTEVDEREEVKAWPCVLCGHFGCDPHHWPVRKSHGAGNSIFEMVPLCRTCHDKVHRGDNASIQQLEYNGNYHYDYLRQLLPKDWEEWSER